MVPIIPFLILPLGASIEKIKHVSFKISLAFLAILGAFFNLVYLVQDVSWFIWGIMGAHQGGLYDIDGAADLWVSPLVLWTFEFSQLTHSILSTNIQTIVFSVDAADKATYEKIRVNGKFEKIMKNLELFAKIRKQHYSKSKHIVKISGVKISKAQSSA